MDFDANEYLSYFLQDAEEHLEIMTDALLALEQSTGDTEAISSLFRVAHTLKSSSAMVGLQEISDFTHHIEDFLSEGPRRKTGGHRGTRHIVVPGIRSREGHAGNRAGRHVGRSQGRTRNGRRSRSCTLARRVG